MTVLPFPAEVEPTFPRLFVPAPHFPVPCPVPIPPEPEEERSPLFDLSPAQREARLQGFFDGFRGVDRQEAERLEVLADYLEGLAEGRAQRTGEPLPLLVGSPLTNAVDF